MNKAILMAGGSGSRLFPVTRAVNKHLLPVFDKPMIFYPIETLKSLGVTDILLVTNPKDIPAFKRLLGSGTELGINLVYAAQDAPGGIPEGIVIGENFLQGQSFYLALADNIFLGAIPKASPHTSTVYLKEYLDDKSQFGVYDPVANLIEEKPLSPKSQLVVTGLYSLQSSAVSLTKSLKQSKRGELEIVDLLNLYAASEKLSIVDIKEADWFDCGTFRNLLAASIHISLHP